MLLGRQPEAVGGLEETPPPGRRRPRRSRTLFDRPTDVAWDAAGQHLRLRRLRQLACREVRQERQVHQVRSGRGARARPVEHCRTRSRPTRRATCTSATAATSAFRCSTTTWRSEAIYDNVGAPWAVCITPGPHQYLYSSNSNPDSNNSDIAAVTGEIYKMELDGTILGKFGKAGKQLGEFSTVHEIDCRNDNELLDRPRSRTGACRSSPCIRRPREGGHQAAVASVCGGSPVRVHHHFRRLQ